jgi:hypothetical protein
MPQPRRTKSFSSKKEESSFSAENQAKRLVCLRASRGNANAPEKMESLPWG